MAKRIGRRGSMGCVHWRGREVGYVILARGLSFLRQSVVKGRYHLGNIANKLSKKSYCHAA